MIVIGYQGIGKSTLAGQSNCVDLESGNFWVDGKRDAEWYKPYCNIALHLHRQGYVVCISSHAVVREYLKTIASEDDRKCIFVCCPEKELKDAWIHKLKSRYEDTRLEKDYKAWKNAEDRFDENIDELHHSGFKIIPLDMMAYNLAEEIAYCKEKRCH